MDTVDTTQERSASVQRIIFQPKTEMQAALMSSTACAIFKLSFSRSQRSLELRRHAIRFASLNKLRCTLATAVQLSDMRRARDVVMPVHLRFISG